MIEINTLILGDCLEVMKQIPDESIDLIATDPPYGINYNDDDLAAHRESIFGGKIENQVARPILNDGLEDSLKLLESFLIEAKRILKKGGNCICFSAGGGPGPLFAHWALLMDRIIGYKQLVIWDKVNIGMGMHYRRVYECVHVSQKGSPAHRWEGGNMTSNIWHIPRIIPSIHQHPTQKPVEIMEQILKTHSREGDTVLDPFAGGSTTAIACMNLNRNFICIELDPQFYKMGTERINEHKAQTRIERIKNTESSSPLITDTIPETKQVTL